MRFYLSIFNILLVMVCYSCHGQNRDDDFEERANEYFSLQYENLDLHWLDNIEKCVLRNFVNKELKTSNTRKILTVGDSLEIKKYFIPSTSTDFAFARGKNGFFSFVMLPHLHDLLFDSRKYYSYSEGLLYPKDSFKIVKVDSELLNKFLNTSGITASRNEEQSNQVLRFLYSTFFRHEIQAVQRNVKLTQMKFGSDLIGTINKIVNDDTMITTTTFIDGVGFVLFCNGILNGKDVEIYFVPLEGRNFVSMVESIPYKDCLD